MWKKDVKWYDSCKCDDFRQECDNGEMIEIYQTLNALKLKFRNM